MKCKRAAALLPLLFLVGCGVQTYTQDFFAMDTFMAVTLYQQSGKADLPQVAGGLVQHVNALETALSRTWEDSDLYRLNHAGGAETAVSADTYAAIEAAVHYAALTDGAFDPTTAPVADLWGIGTDAPRVPPQSEIEAALAHVGYQNVELHGDGRVQLKNGAQLDLGGIGKGYAADRANAYFKQSGQAVSALCMLGGNIGLVGENPEARDGNWKIGIADPDNNAEYVLTVAAHETSVVTSGDYERVFEQDGKRYHHIFDPKTGYPAATDLRSVTVIDADSTKADAMTTALFVMGLDRGLAFCDRHGIAAVFITKDKRIVQSADADSAGAFAFTGAEKGYTYVE